MTQQELDAQLKIYQYHRSVLEQMFPQMFGCRSDDGYGDDRYQQEREEERYSQEGN